MRPFYFNGSYNKHREHNTTVRASYQLWNAIFTHNIGYVFSQAMNKNLQAAFRTWPFPHIANDTAEMY